MDFAIDEDVSVLVAGIADFFKRRDDRRAIASAAATGPAADRARWIALCELGVPALRVAPPRGIGAGLLDAVSLAEEMGAVLLPEPATASIVLAKLWAERGGSSGLLDAVLDGSPVVQFAPFNWLRLSGTVNGAVHSFDDGITDLIAAPAILTDDGAAALAILDRSQFPNGGRCNNVDPSRPVAADRLYGVWPLEVLRLDTAALDAAISEATVLMAGELVGGMAAVLAATIHYVQERRQFGRSIGSFQAVKHRLADMYIAVEQARAAVQFAAIGYAQRSDNAASDVAAAARWVPMSAINLFDNAIHLHGAMGYSWELDIHLHLRRALVTRDLFNRRALAS